ncbi:unnamed protein product [Hymenolepis diminuta]|uniref:MFS domain-containing protein n=1 Tax=Hymenolepis diminuta TaxID=6216 RepID=A0A0R3SRB0_HYMDI|nr:unnamed protein product [Hymenolepis diminuta]
MVSKVAVDGALVVMAGFFIHLSYGCMYTIGNMIPYIASYIADQNDGKFNNGLVAWLAAAPFLTQGIVMPFGGMLAAKIGSKLVVMFGSVTCSLASGI